MFQGHGCAAEIRKNARRIGVIAVAAICCTACCSLAQTQQAASEDGGTAPILSAQLPDTQVPKAAASESTIPPKAMGFYQRAVKELHHQAAASAEKDALRAARFDAGFADAYALAATSALAQQRFKRAQVEAENAVAVNAGDEKAWVVLATADNHLGEYASATDALQHVSHLNATTWQVAYEQARAEAGKGNGAKMLQWANVAALTAPEDFAPLHLLRASALLGVEQYSAAADELEIYLELLGRNAAQREALQLELDRLRTMAERESADATQ